jgi:hypothetical protein
VAASRATAAAAGLVGESHKRGSSHDFDSGLAWEKESENANAFRGLERGAGDRGRRTAARRDTMAIASQRRGGKG